MADFGWAFLSGAVSGQGVEGSLQFVKDTNGALTGSHHLTWNNTTNDLFITGSVRVSGSVFAQQIVTRHEDIVISRITTTGSTKLGANAADTHQMTGSLMLNGGLKLSGSLSLHYQHAAGATVNVLNTSVIVGLGNNTSTTVNLPAANTCNPGQTFIIKDEANVTRTDPANVIVIDPNGSDTIDYASEYRIAGNFVAVSIYTNGTDKWFIY